MPMSGNRAVGRRCLTPSQTGREDETMDSASINEQYEHLLYDELDEGTIVRIVLNRAKYRNAQPRPLLVELDHAFLRAEADDNVRVVILSGAGTMFSSGHD